MQDQSKPGLSSSAKIILWCTIILVVFLSGAMFFMWNYLQELSGSPLVVGAQKIAQANNADDVYCTCQLSGDFGINQERTFFFNTSGIYDRAKDVFFQKPELSLSP